VIIPIRFSHITDLRINSMLLDSRQSNFLLVRLVFVTLAFAIFCNYVCTKIPKQARKLKQIFIM